jgi:hypothetical protein
MSRCKWHHHHCTTQSTVLNLATLRMKQNVMCSSLQYTIAYLTPAMALENSESSENSDETKYQGMCLMTWLAWPRRGKLRNPVLCPALEFDADHIVNSFTRKLVDREAIDFVLNNAVCRMHGCILMHKAAKAETLFGWRRKRMVPPHTAYC